MSAPYVYTPHPSNLPTPYTNSYAQYSPFIPDATLYPPSPYSNPSSLPASPNHGPSALPNPNPVPSPFQVNFPSNDPFGSPGSPWNAPYRSRRPSWHGAMDNVGVSPGWLSAPPIGHQRTRSFGDHAAFPGFNQQPPVGQGSFWPASPSSPYYPLYPSISSPRLQIHPYLNGESPRGDLIFDLSLPTFSPIRYLGPGQSVVLSADELNQPATHPPINRLQIICDLIPQWPITLEYNAPSVGPPPPITVYDIMLAVWQNLHVGISHVDWAKLSTGEETQVARAYTRRCRTAASQEMMVRAQGVKKVDFLLDKVWFKGLLRIGESYDQMRLVVG